MQVYTLFAHDPHQGLSFIGNYTEFGKAVSAARPIALSHVAVRRQPDVDYLVGLDPDRKNPRSTLVTLAVRWCRFDGEIITTKYVVGNILDNKVNP